MRLNPIADTGKTGKVASQRDSFFAEIISLKMGKGKNSIAKKRDLYLQHPTGDTQAAHTSSQPQHLCCSPVDALYYVSLPSTGSVPPMQSWMDGGIVSPRTRLTSPGIQIHHQQTRTTHTPAALVSRLAEWEILFTCLSRSRLPRLPSPFIYRKIHKLFKLSILHQIIH